jgi:hypothetical protein
MSTSSLPDNLVSVKSNVTGWLGGTNTANAA